MRENVLWGLIDLETGEIIVEPRYDNIFFYTDELALTEKEGFYGVIKYTGEIISPPVWSDLFFFHNDAQYVRVRRFGHEYILTLRGDVWDMYDQIQMGLHHIVFSEGLAVFRAGRYRGFMDIDQVVVIDAVWDAALPFHEGRSIVRRGGLYGFIDRAGNVISEPQWDEIRPFGYGHTLVRQNGLWGIVNDRGEVIVEPVHVFDFVSNFNIQGELALIRQNGLAGFIATDGRMIEPQWDLVWSNRHSEFIRVSRDGLEGLIDREGNVILEVEWDMVFAYALENIISVVRDGLWGHANIYGEIIVPLEWDFVSTFNYGDATVTTVDGLVGAVDAEGRVFIELIYERLFHRSSYLFKGFFGERDGKFEIINIYGEVIVVAEYFDHWWRRRSW